MHFFNGNFLSLWKKRVNECAHHNDETCKENEQSELHVTKYVGEILYNDKGEYHVHRDSDTLCT